MFLNLVVQITDLLIQLNFNFGSTTTPGTRRRSREPFKFSATASTATAPSASTKKVSSGFHTIHFLLTLIVNFFTANCLTVHQKKICYDKRNIGIYRLNILNKDIDCSWKTVLCTVNARVKFPLINKFKPPVRQGLIWGGCKHTCIRPTLIAIPIPWYCSKNRR